jgi:3-dehydroquinate dehydratase, type I
MKIRNLILGKDIPKICIPIIETNQEAILKEASKIIKTPADMIELRIDYFSDLFNEVALKNLLISLRKIIKDFPLLFTFRTKIEGGLLDCSNEQYLQVSTWAIESKSIDLIDIEIMKNNITIENIIALAKENQIKIIASHHNFIETPSKNLLEQYISKMYQMQVDIYKIAVMPKNTQDVLNLLTFTNQIKEQYPNNPIITIAMSNIGLISRVSGEFFGSALTFASLSNKISAPGQINIYDLKIILEQFHQQLKSNK